MDSYRQWQISQSDYEISSNCGKTRITFDCMCNISNYDALINSVKENDFSERELKKALRDTLT